MEAALRGRSVAVFMPAQNGSLAAGAALLGWAGQQVGPRRSATLGGAASCAVTITAIAAMTAAGRLRPTLTSGRLALETPPPRSPECP
ncbi:hypothetical protein [Actinomadura violacea]|uniref:Uncharacterized protein n=1 Tax=Actinomadura violacea TaxID=2819934 RepID=A0ABS3RJE1_9ACTN|nr:hypothetical protein [Actinomadura violacea]MBO2456869.1 hypothetical protein [Actinomadura violacea]